MILQRKFSIETKTNVRRKSQLLFDLDFSGEKEVKGIERWNEKKQNGNWKFVVCGRWTKSGKSINCRTTQSYTDWEMNALFQMSAPNSNVDARTHIISAIGNTNNNKSATRRRCTKHMVREWSTDNTHWWAKKNWKKKKTRYHLNSSDSLPIRKLNKEYFSNCGRSAFVCEIQQISTHMPRERACIDRDFYAMMVLLYWFFCHFNGSKCMILL